MTAHPSSFAAMIPVTGRLVWRRVCCQFSR